MSNCFPSSPNWFLSRCCDLSVENDIFSYGSKNHLVFLRVQTDAGEDENIFRFLRTIEAHAERVTGVAFLSTSTLYCVSSGDDGKCRVWSTESYSLEAEFDVSEVVEEEKKTFKATAVDASSLGGNAQVVVGNERGTFFRWDFLGGQCKKYTPFCDVKKPKKTFPIVAISCSKHSVDIVAVGYLEGVILIYDLAGNGIVHKLRGHDEEIQCLHWRPPIENEPPLLASGAKDAHIRIWDVFRGMEEVSMRLPTFSKRGEGDQRTFQTWTSVAWIPGRKNELVGGGYHGELLHWTLGDSADGGKPKSRPINAKGVGHSRMVFNICLGGKEISEERPGLGLYAVSVAQDRNMVVWDLDNMDFRSSTFTCGGFVYALEVSPMDPTLVAVGCGDQHIRVWHRSPGNPTSTFWSGIRGMVSCLNWHPDREGFLAYGTNDGRVGSFDINKPGKAPIISTTYHKRTVYVVKWGPKCVAEGEEVGNPDHKCLFSVGDGNVLQHNLFSKEKAANLDDLIGKANSTSSSKSPTRTSIAWNLNFSLIAIGNEDGCVGIFSHPHLKQLVRLNGHVKLINCLAWKRPSEAEKRECAEDSEASEFVVGGTVLATGAGDNKVCVFYLRETFDNFVDENASVSDLYPRKAFGQHKGRITGLVWSPHEEWLLASASYDGSVQVWNLDSEREKVMIANFRDHVGRTLSVAWDGSDPNMLHSGADDFYLFSWDMTRQTHTEPPSENRFEKRFQENKKKAKELRRKAHGQNHKPEAVSPPAISSVSNVVEKSPGPESSSSSSSIPNGIQEGCNFSEGAGESLLVDEEIKDLLHSKEEELMLKSLGDSSPVNSSLPALNKIVESAESVTTKTSNNLTGGKKPKLFRHTLGHFNNLPIESQMESFMALSHHAKHNLGGEKRKGIVKFKESKPAKDLVDEFSNFGLFTDRDAASRLIDKEKSIIESGVEVDDVSAEHNFQLEFMRGNLSKALDEAILAKKLTDWMVSMTIMSSPYLRQKACVAYAEQLIHPSSNEGPDPKKASLYLLACNMIYEAIQVLEEFKLFREAISLAKLRLRREDPMIHRLLVGWAKFECRNGQSTHGAHCFVAAGEYQEAAAELRKRKSELSRRAAEYVGMIGAPELQNGNLRFALEYVSRCLANDDWIEALKFCLSFENLHEYVPNVLAHRLLTLAAGESVCLATGNVAAFPDLIESVKDQTFYDIDLDPVRVKAAQALEDEGEEWLVTLHTQIQCLLPSLNLQNARFLQRSFSDGSKSEFLFNVSTNLTKAAVLAMRYQLMKKEEASIVDGANPIEGDGLSEPPRLADIVQPLCENMASCAKRGEYTLVWRIHQSFFPYGLEEFIPDLHANSASDVEAKNQFFKLAAIFDLYGNWWESVIKPPENAEVDYEESEAMSTEDMQCWLDILLPVEPPVDGNPGEFDFMHPSREESVSVLLGYVLSDKHQSKANCDLLLRRIDSLADKPELRAWAKNRKEALVKRAHKTDA